MNPNESNAARNINDVIPVHGSCNRSPYANLKVLSTADWDHWVHEGYVVIKNAVPVHQVERLAAYIWTFENKDPHDSETWYRRTVPDMEMKELVNTGMVELYHHQYLWDNRQTPKIHQAFSDIWGTEKLWASIDRVNLNFPIRDTNQYESFIHWDYNPADKPQNVQGVLALSDQVDPAMGGFQCVPALYREYEKWIHTQGPDRDPYKPDTSGFEVVKVPLEAGDLLIFNSLLPHGIRPNFSDKVRIAQYLSMIPADESNEALRTWRINAWKNRDPMKGYAFPGDPGMREKANKVAELSPLGKKLLGLDSW
jgi:ectoine hydroxylase-related dioxygenase (phytanoyl-CoA dioxygenase family)